LLKKKSNFSWICANRRFLYVVITHKPEIYFLKCIIEIDDM
jgi:hypothetical protein